MSVPAGIPRDEVEAVGPGPKIDGLIPLQFVEVDLRRQSNAMRRFSLDIAAGQVVAVVGDEESFVGRLGSFSLGLTRPPEGTVMVLGEEIASLPYDALLQFRRRIGYLPLGDGLMQNLTLRDNISLPLRYASDHNLRIVEERVGFLLERFGLESVATLRPAQANEEERRRAAAARSVALDPELVVLEAPFDGMTSRASRVVLERVRQREDGTRRSVLVTVQDLPMAVSDLVDRVIRVADGQAVEESRQ